MATHEVTEEMTVKAARLCAEFMGGSWAGITRRQLVVDRVKGGLSNEIYKCSLAEQVGNSPILYNWIETEFSILQKGKITIVHAIAIAIVELLAGVNGTLTITDMF